MNFNKLNDGLVFDSVSGVIGKAVGIDLINQKVTIVVGEKFVSANLEDCKFLELLGHIGSQVIHNHDVVIDNNDDVLELALKHENSELVSVFLLNKKLERVREVTTLTKTDLSVLENRVAFINNLLVLDPEETVDFNIRVVREMKNGRFVAYHYACNDKKEERVDVIKVVFIGSHLLDEESYSRVTLTYEQYLEDVANGYLVEVDPRELQRYASGYKYQDLKQDNPELPDEEEDVDWEDYDEECEDGEEENFDEEDEDEDEEDPEDWEESFWKDPSEDDEDWD